MEEKNLTGSYKQEEKVAVKNQNGTKFIQIISVIFLPVLWIGYFYSLYIGNQNNVNSYTSIIMIFSLINSDILFSKERMENSILNIMAKIEGLLLVVMAAITIVNLIIK